MSKELAVTNQAEPVSQSGDHSGGVPPARVRGQLETILASDGFRGSGRTRAILRFVVDQTLAGRAGEIKGLTIAMQVLGRTSSFDASKDPIVSIEARKLRQGLEHYYLGEGRSDAIVVTVPKGSYIPEFSWRQAGVSIADRMQAAESRWSPTLAVDQFRNHSGDAALDLLCQEISIEVLVGLTRFNEITVRRAGEAEPSSGPPGPVAGIVRGHVRHVGGEIKISVLLENGADCSIVWADDFRIHASSAGDLGLLGEGVGRKVVARVGGEHGAFNKYLVPGMWVRAPLGDATSYEAMIAYFHFDRQRSKRALDEVLPLLRHAASRDPSSGVLKAMLAATKIFVFAQGFSEEVGLLEEALELSTGAVRLEPENQFCLETQAWALFHLGQNEAALEHLESAYRLNPNAAYRVALIGWDMMLCGAWERGREILESAMELNPTNPSWLGFAICFDEFRRGRYAEALVEAGRPDLPASFWIPLMQAAALGRLGRLADGRAAGEELLRRLPEFAKRGRILISRLIKQRQLFTDIVTGLEVVGVRCGRAK